MSKTLENLLAVSGMSGLYKMKTNRSNGLIVEDLDEGKSQFVSMRKHQFTPLESVAIFTFTDSVELEKVFKTMAEKESDLPVVNVNHLTVNSLIISATLYLIMIPRGYIPMISERSSNGILF